MSPSFEVVEILGKDKFDKLLTLEALFIAEIKHSLKMNLSVEICY